MSDYYKTLGINKSASADQIKSAYRELVKKYHPDKYYGKPEYKEMNDKFKEINEAYQVLADSEKKQMYDQYGPAFEQAKQRGGAGGFEGFRDYAAYAEAMKNAGGGFSSDFGDLGDLGDIFSSFFGGGTRTRRSSARRGKDLHYQMEITFREAAFGAEKEIPLEKFNVCRECGGSGVDKNSKYNTCSTCGGAGRVNQRQRTFFGDFETVVSCSKCGGQGKIPEKECGHCRGEGRIKERKNVKIKIPAGINNEQTINYHSQGEAGKGGVGDLYITFNVKSDREFSRDGFDVLSEKNISISEAVLGDKVQINTLEGEVTLKIPNGTKSGQVFKLAGKGIQHLHGHGKGNQLVTINIKIPNNLSRKQRELLEELKKEGL